MKIDQEYVANNIKEISHTIYAKCEEDIQFQFNLNIIRCYKSIIYKFSLKAGVIYLVKDFSKLDVDKSIIYEEEEIPIEKYYNKFTVIGDLNELIKYIEG